jgi:hypothetical protein
MEWLLNGLLFAAGVAAFVLIIRGATFVIEFIDEWLRSTVITFVFGFVAIFAALLAFNIFRIYHT